MIIDTRPLIRGLVADVNDRLPKNLMARRFHSTMAELIVVTCQKLRAQTGLSKVVLSGGVFMNALLAREAEERLTAAGFLALRHRAVPPNDGGLSLGQLAIAARQLHAS